MTKRNWILVILLVFALFDAGCKKKKNKDNQAQNPNDIPVPTASASPAAS